MTGVNLNVRPPRTLGIAIAILASALAFGCLPLTQVGFILLVQLRIQNADLLTQTTEGEVAPIAVGGDFLGVEPFNLLSQGLLGVLFLILCLFAWRGRPSWIRRVMTTTVLGMTALTVIITLIPLLQQADLQRGIDSAEGARRVLLTARLIGTLIVSAYVVWYLNRAPARAFFRGRYLVNRPDQRDTPSRGVSQER